MSEISTGEPNFRYTAQLAGEIENKWQDLWDERGTFFADNPEGDLAGDLASRDPFFLLDMFPTPQVRVFMLGTHWAISRLIRLLVSTVCAAKMFFTQWDMTLSVFLPSNLLFKPVNTRV